MKTMTSFICLVAVCLVLVYVGEKNLFFSNYPLFLAIFAALSLLITLISFWVTVGTSLQDKTEQNDN